MCGGRDPAEWKVFFDSSNQIDAATDLASYDTELKKEHIDQLNALQPTTQPNSRSSSPEPSSSESSTEEAPIAVSSNPFEEVPSDYSGVPTVGLSTKGN